MRKIYLLFLLFFLNACTVTDALWNKGYEETFRQFFVSVDGNYAVFIGRDYHYVFMDETGVLSQILMWPRRDLIFIDVSQTKLYLDRQNNLEGHVEIRTFYSTLPPEEAVFLEALGFKQKEYGPLFLKLKLKGRRYAAREDLISYMKLTRTYIIEVHQPQTFFGSIAKATLTPITVAADATIFIGKVLLIPFNKK